jgi:uncharacterized protein
MEFPYGPSLGLPDRFEGREAVTRYLKAMLQQLGSLKFRDIEIVGTEDPGLFVNEYKATLRTPKGTTYNQVYISKIHVKDGKVVMYREFLGPGAGHEGGWRIHRQLRLAADLSQGALMLGATSLVHAAVFD